MIRVNNAFCQSLTSRYVAEKAGPVFISSLTLFKLYVENLTSKITMRLYNSLQMSIEH